jgi:hypothetical protein
VVLVPGAYTITNTFVGCVPVFGPTLVGEVNCNPDAFLETGLFAISNRQNAWS